MADITITPNDTLELTYSVSNYTNELDEILNINILTDSDEENTKSDITSNINDADVFYWQPSENDVGGEYEFELSNNTSITVEIIDIPNIKNLQSRYVAEELDLSEGDPVSTWYDLEGDFNGHQETSGVQPTFRDDDLNNLATVEFNRDYLLTGHNQNSNEESSIYIVARVDDTSENRGIYGAGGSGSGNRHYIRMQDNPNWQVGFGGTADISSSATSGEWKIFGFNAGANGNFRLRIDGSEILRSSFNGEGENPDDDAIGARNDEGVTDELVGKIAEILRYDVDHGSEMASEVEKFLDDRYDIID